MQRPFIELKNCSLWLGNSARNSECRLTGIPATMWMEGKPWTAVELHEIELALVERMTHHQIARCLMRNPNEVTEKVWEIEAARAVR